jgi:hypothetical protein
MPSLSAQIVQVGQLFASPFVVEAPSYQRSFAWSSDEAGQLLDDISSAIEEAQVRDTGGYFLGTMLFIDREGASSRRAWPRTRALRVLEVVDGFQRLTTLTILFCVVRDLADADGPTHARLQAAIQANPARPRLALRPSEDKFFDAFVRLPGATRVSGSKDGLAPAETRILQVRDHFIATLETCSGAELQRLADFLLDQCCAVMVATTDIDRAHRMFTVLNASGKPLARNDILKAVLFGDVPASAAPRCMAIWNDAETRLGAQFESLFSHIRAMYGRPGGQVISGIVGICASEGGAQVFIERILQPAVRIYCDIRSAQHAGSPSSAGIAGHLRYLNWHSFADWIPAAMLWWLKKGDDVQSLERFLARLDRLAFGVRVLGIGGTKRTRRFGAVIAAVREDRDLSAPSSPLEFSRQELRTIHHYLRDLHARNASAAKQLLLRLAEAKGDAQCLAPDDDLTVEHVLPRTIRASSEWRDWYPDPEEREQCTESLGNLVLVTKAQNDKAGNHDLARKLEVYFNTRGAPAIAINEGLRGKREWKAADIRVREAEMYQLIERLWQFGFAPPKAEAGVTAPGKPAGGAQKRVPAPTLAET